MTEVDSPNWAFTVSVRSLSEFTAKQGDLDRRFTPSATALEGQTGQQLVASSRGSDYQSEVALQTQLQTQYGALLVRGRADGYDPRRQCLEEIKTLRGTPQDMAVNKRQLHWAQLQTYGALWCRQQQVDQIALSLVYLDLNTQQEHTLDELCSAADLEAALLARCAQFADWAQQEALHRQARDALLRELPFPQPQFRAGQRYLAAAVYRAALQGQSVLAQAPTGIGKTLGTLYPLLRAMPEQGIDKLACLSCKGTGQAVALQALRAMSGTAQETAADAPGQLRVLVMVPKTQACEHPDKACHPQSCPLAQGFYDRLPAARSVAIRHPWLDAETQRRIALQHDVCPYYLGQEMVRWADVVVGDVHHAFDARGQLWGLSQALDWRLAVWVDEAHNLLERTRQMYSAELRLSQLQQASAVAPAPLQAPLNDLLAAVLQLGAEQDGDYAAIPVLPDAAEQALSRAAAALAEYFQQHPLAVGELLQFHFELQRFVRLVDGLDARSLLDVQRLPLQRSLLQPPPLQGVLGDAATPAENGAELALNLRTVVPARFLRARFEAWHMTVLVSATLGPPEFPIQMLGLPQHCRWLDLPPAFPPEHLQVQVARQVSTRWAHRSQSLDALVAVMVRQLEQHPGNYLAFFSSFEYLDQAADRLALLAPHLPQWRQDRSMPASQRQAFLDRFVPGGHGLGFAVLGGVFGEGIDLPGSRLIGAFIATLGLPPVSPMQQQMQQRLDLLFGPDHGYADLVPAMHKVVQAGGRVLRSADDRGWLWLLDQRYAMPQVQRLLPAWWGLSKARPLLAGAEVL